MKKWLSVLMVIALLSFSSMVLATTDNGLMQIVGAIFNDQLRFRVNGQPAVPVGADGKPVLPISYNGTTYLPVRAIANMLGFGVNFDGATKTVLITTSTPAPIPVAQSQVWKLQEVRFNDATGRKDSVLMGTSAGLYDLTSYKGEGNDLTIKHNRYDTASGKLLAGVTYQVTWTDPPEILVPDQKYSIDYSVRTIESLTWKPPQQSIYLDQGMGVYFASPDGTKYINTDISAMFTSEKAIATGVKGKTRTIRIVHGDGFTTTYVYGWVE